MDLRYYGEKYVYGNADQIEHFTQTLKDGLKLSYTESRTVL